MDPKGLAHLVTFLPNSMKSSIRLNSLFDALIHHGDDPYWWNQRISQFIIGPVLGRIHGNDGINIMERDWDNLMILDACRADMFETTINTNSFDNYECINSVGSMTEEWMEKTFSGEKFPDTVYISANPWITKVAPESFHDIISFWEIDDQGQERIADDDSGAKIAGDGDQQRIWRSIYADELNSAAQRAHKKYPNKRLIIHYFQPHSPCIGNSDGSRKDNVDTSLHPGDDLMTGNVDKESVWNAYVENLQYVMTYARELASLLGGKSVISSDHGELFGERMWLFPIRGYAHPKNLRHPKLTTVPWAEITHGKRRKILSGVTTDKSRDHNDVDERLESLGYKM